MLIFFHLEHLILQSNTMFLLLNHIMIRLLRSVLSVKDEFYHRHIVQYNLFAPVFDLFREKANMGVGNNLISSTILEVRFFILEYCVDMCYELPQLFVETKSLAQTYFLSLSSHMLLYLFLL